MRKDDVMSGSEQTIENRPIAALRPHPRQHEIFHPPLPFEIDELAADLTQNGQLTPVEVLPCGTIIAGHKRVAAAGSLGWNEIQVWVRHDLAHNPGLAVERLIEDNLLRRQLGPLEIARCYREMKAAGRSGRRRLSSQDHDDLRDQVGKRLGVSGRTLDRYLRVLEGTPQEVQDAVAMNKLGISLAEKIVGLPRKEREGIAAEIRAGGVPSLIVRKQLKRGTPAQPVRKFLRELERCLADHDRIQDMGNVHLSDADLRLLERAQTAIATLQRQVPRSPNRKKHDAAANADGEE
jgi:ParB-like chromosome segregation protein Spo0J